MPSLLVVVTANVAVELDSIFASGKHRESRFAGNCIPSRRKSVANLNSRSVKDSQSYQSLLVKWLILENEKKTTVFSVAEKRKHLVLD